MLLGNELYEQSLVEAAEIRCKLLSPAEVCDVYNFIMIYQIHCNVYGVLANPAKAAICSSAFKMWLSKGAATLREAMLIASIVPAAVTLQAQAASA
jgi:hypothetical protein